MYLKYNGQVYDVEFIIINESKLLLSLHYLSNQKSLLIVTDLMSHNAIMKVPIDIEGRKICVHPNNRDISVISMKDEYNRGEVIISLAFAHNTETII